MEDPFQFVSLNMSTYLNSGSHGLCSNQGVTVLSGETKDEWTGFDVLSEDERFRTNVVVLIGDVLSEDEAQEIIAVNKIDRSQTARDDDHDNLATQSHDVAMVGLADGPEET